MVAEKGHRFRQPLVHLPRAGGLNITARCSRTARGAVIPRAAVAPALNNYCQSLIMIMWCVTSTDNIYYYYKKFL